MTRIDYMKVIDIIAKTLRSEKNVEITNPEKEINIFQVDMTAQDNVKRTCRLTLNEYDLIIVFEKTNFKNNEYEKWLASFEYELEQEFFRNIKIEQSDDVSHYKLKVSF